jgi:serine/threonine protein kinase
MPSVPTCPHGHRWLLTEEQDAAVHLPFVCPVCGAIDLTNSIRLTKTFSHPEEPVSVQPLSGYEIVGELGRGGMGVVYRAYDPKRQRQVALKTMQRVDATALYRFKQEFRALAGLIHPNLVTLYELISDGRDWFFTMELIEGVSLLKHVRSESGSRDPAVGSREGTRTTYSDSLPPTGAPRSTANNQASGLTPEQLERLRDAMRQLACGIHALHEAGKLHRDIKPGNVLVTKAGRVVLLDFGITADLDRAGLHQSTEPHLLGTVAYMAPEQAGNQPVSAASDWYAVGVILYEALTGRLPFEGPSLQVLMNKQQAEPPAPSTLVPGVAVDLDLLAVELLQRNPEERPAGPEVLRRLGGPPAEPGPTVAPRPVQGPGRNLVGRKRHLEFLADAFTAARRGQTVVVHLYGRSGIGKSALVRSFLEQVAQGEEAVILVGRCYEQEAVPYKALDSLVDDLTRYLVRLPAQEAEVLLPRDVASLARVFPVLRRVSAVAQAPGRALNAADAQEIRRRALSALRELLGRLGDRRPVVLFVDDLQWGDADSAALMADLLRPPESPALLLVVGYRSEDAAANPSLGALLHTEGGPPLDRRDLALEPLSPEESRALALSLLDGTGPELTACAEAIARESGGNPFFLHELAQHTRQSGPDLLGVRCASALDISLDEVLWDRVSRLPAEARRLLEVVAVAGRPLRQAEACRAAGVGSEGFTVLAQMRAARLVRGVGPTESNEVETYHDRVRETVVAHLAPGDLRGHHRELSRALEAGGRADPERLAVHFQGANEPDQAGKYYALAAVQATEALAFDRAAKLYRLALALQGARASGGPTVPADAALRWLRIGLGDALANAGRGAESAREYLIAAEGAGSAEALELRRRAALQFLISGRVDEGLATLRTVLSEVGLAMPRRAFWSLIGRRAQLRFRGLGFRPREADTVAPKELSHINVCWTAAVGLSMVDSIQGAYFQTRGLLRALDAGIPYHLARALAMEAAHASIGGGRSRKRTARLLEMADGLARQVQDPYPLGMVAMARGIAAAFVGHWHPALDLSDQAAAIFRDSCTGVVWESDTAHRFALWALMFRGDVAEMTRRLPSLLKEAQERDDLYALMNLSLVVGTFVRLAADEPDRARGELERVMDRWSRQGFHVQHMNRLYDEVQIDLYRGDGKAAWDRLAAQWSTFAGSHFYRVQQVRIIMRHLRARSALAAAADSPDRAAFLLTASRDAALLEKERLPWSDGLARLIRAGVAVGPKRAEAATMLREAADGFEAADMSLHAAAARRLLGDLAGGDEGRAAVARADNWMKGQGIQNPARLSALLAPGFPW